MNVIDPALLQALANRIAGVAANGYSVANFPAPLDTLWQAVEVAPAGTGSQAFMQWAGNDSSRLDLAAQILSLLPGGQPPPDPWKVRTLKDAYQPRPPLLYLVEGIIVVPSLVVCYGAPGVMKSLLMADMATCVASGKPWLYPKDSTHDTRRDTQQAAILWCDFDNGKRRTDERFDALGRGRNLPDTAPIYYVSMPMPWLNATDHIAIEELRIRAVKLAVKLIIVDNLGTISGKADENSAEMIEVMANLRYLAEEVPCALVVLHHQRKAGMFTSRSGDTLRGHSSIEAALDLALLVEREEHSDTIKVKSTKTRDIDVFPFGAEFEFVHKPGTKELATAFFWGIQLDDTNSDSAVTTAIIDAIQQLQPVKQQDLVTAVKANLPEIGVNRIRSLLAQAIKLGTVLVTKGAKNACLYELP